MTSRLYMVVTSAPQLSYELQQIGCSEHSQIIICDRGACQIKRSDPVTLAWYCGEGVSSQILAITVQGMSGRYN